MNFSLKILLYKQAAHPHRMRRFSTFSPLQQVCHRLLLPFVQEEILKVVAQFGSIEGIGFDHYVTDWDFD